jgi:hypothetical protein
LFTSDEDYVVLMGMHGGRNTPLIALLVLASALFAWLGAGIPLHFHSVSRQILEEAGRNTRTTQAIADEYLLSGKTGPLGILWDAHLAKPSEIDRTRIAALTGTHPVYRFSGGPSPYYETFLASLPAGAIPHDAGKARVIDVLLARTNSEIALEHLRRSTNVAALALLDARNLTQWRRLMPVTSPAGRPLDASITALAMFADADALRPEFAAEIVNLAANAKKGDRPAAEKLENALLSTLVLGRRLDWTEMSELLRCVKSSGDLSDLASRTATSPEAFPALYAATLLKGDYAPVAQYLGANGNSGVRSIRIALRNGSGALDALFAQGYTVYDPPAPIAWFDKALAHARPAFVTRLAMRHRIPFIFFKGAFFLLSGIALALAIGRTCKGVWCIPCASRREKCLPIAAKVFVAASLAILIGLLLEPNLLRFSTESPARAVFAITAGTPTPQTKAMNANSLDSASVLSLVFFFLVQLAIYIFSVMRVKRLRAMDLPAKTQLKLLENDDNLFDLGLYIGLAGTVGSLLMLAMNIIQASLVAAYSSTLFGILFVAFLKVVHIRAFRRELILKIQSEDDGRKA